MKKVLLVDDSRLVHAYMEDCLKGTDCVLEHAYNGEEALEAVKGRDEFDLIFMDWEMPKMEGREAVRRLRADGVTTPIVMLTSKGEAENISEMLELGATEYMIKPFTPDILKGKMKEILGE